MIVNTTTRPIFALSNHSQQRHFHHDAHYFSHQPFDAKDALKSLGFKWDGEEKHWAADYSKETWEAVLPILKKYDTKVWPEKLGMGRCWECGCYSKHLDADGYCGC